MRDSFESSILDAVGDVEVEVSNVTDAAKAIHDRLVDRRTYLAGQAMAVLMADTGLCGGGDDSPAGLAREAVEYADALIAALDAKL